MKRKLLRAGAALAVASLSWVCRPGTSEQVLFENSMADLSGVLTRSGVELDRQVTSDGDGSIKIVAAEPTTVRLFEVDQIDVEDARLIYRARLRAEKVDGQVYLEMWCRFPGSGEFFSRALHDPISGSTEWVSQETPFFLKEGEKPDLVKLNVVIDGTGTVWVDDVKLTRRSS